MSISVKWLDVEGCGYRRMCNISSWNQPLYFGQHQHRHINLLSHLTRTLTISLFFKHTPLVWILKESSSNAKYLTSHHWLY